ncbi:MAG: YggS family pyridoxal phosphate-dependent enzyme [Deltaproteobacteria bacterium]|nr:YggS family pyridoxal phosphate-dependent enzyme [Deltaproteobacteria bacterium]
MSEPASLSFAEARERLSQVRARMDAALTAAGRRPGDAELLAVSKTFPPSSVAVYRELGQLDFGENYVQEAADKIPALPADLRWHFIGHLQTNKAKRAAALFDVVHAVDSLELAAELDKRLGLASRKMRVYVQVNVSGEDVKSGLSPDELPAFLEGLARFGRLQAQGLMTMPPYDPDPEASRPHFRRLRDLRDRCAPQLTGLSMGMSGDFHVALSEGATVVRVGTALFGAR